MENLAFTLAILKNVRTFVVRQIFIINDMGVFYTHKVACIFKYREKLYPCFIGLMSIKVCRRIGYDFSLFYFE